MFKFSAVSQIWKKYIQKLNDWDLSYSFSVYHFSSLLQVKRKGTVVYFSN